MATEVKPIVSGYDRQKELKAFDDTKAGVKGLVDSGVARIPRIFISPADDLITGPFDAHLEIPVIDLEGIDRDSNQRKKIIEEVRCASETWGFFQLVNHGIPVHLLDEMLQGVRRFHEGPHEVKSQYYSRDITKKFRYNSNFNLYQAPATNWRDTFIASMAPDQPNPDEIPRACRDILIEYSRQVTRLGTLLFELLSEALMLKPRHLIGIGCAEGLGVLGHYYPACPEPELTLGATKHSDNDFLTVLLQDQTGGLQVLRQNHWIDVQPIPGSLVINIGDLLQLVSNDRFKSSEHRVLANREGPRMSVASFFSTFFRNTSTLFGPIKELLSEDNPAVYRDTTIRDYNIYYNEKERAGNPALARFKL